MPVNDSGPGDTLDTVMNLLADSHRRQLVLALAERNPQRDDAMRPEDVFDGDQREELLIGLRHNHLPKLADADVIEWNRSANLVRRGPRFEAVYSVIRPMQDHIDELPYELP